MEIDLDRRLIAVARRHDDAVARGVDGEDRTQRGIQFGVHQDQVLAVRERFERHLRAKLDRAGNVHQGVEVGRPAEQVRIVGDDGHRRRQRPIERLLRPGHHGLTLRRRIGEGGDRLVDAPGIYGGQAHAGHVIDDLVGHSAPHEASADHAQADRMTLRFALAQRGVDDDQPWPPFRCAGAATGATAIRARIDAPASAKGCHARSFGDISVAARGHMIPRPASL